MRVWNAKGMVLLLAAVIWLQWPGMAPAAPTVINPSFEVDPVPDPWPHYTAAITGWTKAGGGLTGLNDTSGPFMNNGIIPDGAQVAFFQNAVSLTQSVAGFETGKTYRLSLRANSRLFGTGDRNSSLRVTLGGTELIAPTSIPIVGDGVPFQLFEVDFTSPGAGAFDLTIANMRADVDNALLIDAVAIGDPAVVEPPQSAWDTMSDTWAATDALGRVMPLRNTTGPVRSNKTVALFYYIWHGNHSTGLYDIEKILAGNPADPAWGPVNAFHFYSEPLYGYYLASDPYVHLKNAQFMADAGVDVIFFDATNAFDYKNIYLNVICPLYAEIRARGGKTPQIAFLTHTRSGDTVQKIYDDFYSKGLYEELWFKWKGKPLILATPSEMSQQTLDFFNVRYSWAWAPGQDKWPWLEHYPQQGGWHEAANIIEQMVVETAQHPGSNSGWGIGKSYHNGAQPHPGSFETDKGLYFAEHWSRALAVDPQLIFITQWNEWVAQRFIAAKDQRYAGVLQKAGDSYFVDVYSPEFNRDIEPMKSGYKDNYYYQMVEGIRRYKGTRALPAASAPRPIDLADFSQWDSVAPEYRDDLGDKSTRNSKGWGTTQYTNTTGRNDLKRMKVARDDANVYFMAETIDPLTARTGTNWMRLFIAVNGRAGANWEGFHYLIQPRTAAVGAPLVLMQAQGGGWNWQEVGEVAAQQSGRQLALVIPRAQLGLAAGGNALSIRFKWSDNMQQNDPLDWTLNGDAAPNNRFQYRYEALNVNEATGWALYH